MKRIVTLLAVVILLALPACQAGDQVVETAAPVAQTYPLEVQSEEAYPVDETDQPSRTMNKSQLIMPRISQQI